MVTSVMLVGRLAQDIEIKKLDSGKEVSNVALAVNRSFKNPDGTYDFTSAKPVKINSSGGTVLTTDAKGKGRMNSESTDEKYTELIGNLRTAMKSLARRIEPKVYEYGFLKR